MKKLIAILILTLSAKAFPQDDWVEPDHLVPDPSVFADPFLMDYYLMVSKLLSSAGDNIARVLVFPSFSVEYELTVNKVGDGYGVKVKYPGKSFWGYKTLELMRSGEIRVHRDGEVKKDDEGIRQLQQKYSVSPDEMPIHVCTKQLDDELAGRIAQVWEKQLRRTRFPTKGWSGLDGVHYHFAKREGFQMLAGATWSPSRHLPTGKLVNVVEALYDYCHIERYDQSILEGAISQAEH